MNSLRKLETLNRIENYIGVIYEQNMRGNSLVSILASHDESWWINDLMNHTHEPLNHCLFRNCVYRFNFIEFGKTQLSRNTGMMFQDPI